MSVCGPAYRFDRAAARRYVPMVREAAMEVSGVLGWRGGSRSG